MLAIGFESCLQTRAFGINNESDKYWARLLPTRRCKHSDVKNLKEGVVPAILDFTHPLQHLISTVNRGSKSNKALTFSSKMGFFRISKMLEIPSVNSPAPFQKWGEIFIDQSHNRLIFKLNSAVLSFPRIPFHFQGPDRPLS